MTRARAPYRALLGNVAARLGSLASLLVASLVIARYGGPDEVGLYALLHVLPGLLGTLTSAGLAVAATYFLAGVARDDRRLPLTIVAMALMGGIAGAALWIAAAPLFGPVLFPDLAVGLVMLAGVTVLTRLSVTTTKAISQGSDDLAGAGFVIFAEEFMFLPAYASLVLAGASGAARVVGGLVLADVATATFGWTRLVRRRFFAGAARPSPALARRIASYGIRGQVGGLLAQLNLRLDYVILTVLAGPATVGVYAVGSKVAELVKLVGMALTYVLYPDFSRLGPRRAAESARRLLPHAGILTAGAAVPLWVAAGIAIPAFYGSAFGGAVTPARIILLGLVFEGVGAVVTAFLYGVGRPGLNSWAMAVGLTATVGLDALLIPSMGANGAAIASAVAYASTTIALACFFRRVASPRAERTTWGDAPVSLH